MHPLLVLLLLSASLPMPALAGDASVDIGKLEGVYRKREQNGDSSGAKYMTRDVLKIVQLEKGLAYVDIELHFFNGHECSLAGLAETEDGVLVHRNDERGPDEPCELHITPARGRISLFDASGHCRSGSCGARGGYDTEFSLARRQKMSARERRKILANAKEKIAEHKSRKKAQPEAKPQP
jgi:hypothetical protein